VYFKVDSKHCKQLKIAPCREACPAGVNVPLYVRYVREGRFDDALTVIRQSIPFPAVCGYACVHPCERKCARAQFDEPVAIRILKRAAAEYGRAASSKQKAQPDLSTGKKVAIVGAGPGGLTAAYYLAGLGHKITVYEALPEAGGMLRYAIPEYRLPNDVIEQEIATVRELGVEIKTNTRVNAPESLLSDYDAVLVATGTWLSAKMNVEGDANALDGLAFLRQVNSGKPPYVGSNVAVIGGGNTAIDAARTARRLGAKEVTLLYRRGRAEMPAEPEELADAIEEGVKIEFLAAPVNVGKGKITCVRMKLGRKDASGRPAPSPIAGSDFSLACDTVITAVGQLSSAAEITLAAEEKGTLTVDTNFASSRPGVFAAGDVVTGPASIIQAIAQGRQAAAAVDKYLGGRGIIAEQLVPDFPERQEPAPAGQMRTYVDTVDFGSRLNSFSLVEKGYSLNSARREARRCLGCDQVTHSVSVDLAACKACGYCSDACGLGVFEQSKSFNDRGYQPMEAIGSDRCVGCLRCFYACPDFAISVQKAGACQ
jgi:NADPH-dependent glutamate synthase beta subunit-like oxidoreductase/NAD-dependent dihydropyrimidine dehydrogenase PreA subunit